MLNFLKRKPIVFLLLLKIKSIWINFFPKKMWLQMYLVLVIIVTLVNVLLGIFLINTSKKAMKKAVLQNHKEIMMHASFQITSFLKSAEYLLSITSSFIEQLEDDWWCQDSVLVELTIKHIFFKRVMLLDSDGWILADSDIVVHSHLLEKSDKKYIVFSDRIKKAKKIIYTDLYLSKEGLPFLDMYCPIMKFGKLQGFLLAQINLQSIWDIVDGIKIGCESMAYLMSCEGVLISHKDKKKVLSKDCINNLTLNGALKNNIGNLETKKCLSSYILIKDLNWILVVEQKINDVFSFSKKMIKQSWFIILISQFFIFIISIILAKKIVNPVTLLVDKSRDVANGNLDVYIDIKREDEIGDLIDAYNNMIKKLKQIKISENLISIGKAASVITHELKNSIVLINTFIKLLNTQYSSKEFMRKFFMTVPKEIDRWKSMLEDISDFSRISEFEKTHINISNILLESIVLVAEKIKDADIVFKKNILKKDFIIDGNADRLKQVFVNIFLNAIKAVDLKGCISVELTDSLLENDIKKLNWDKSDKKKIIVKIKDNGYGIKKENLEKIFEPFYSTKKGMGLGLTITKNILERHGAYFSVDSEQEQGTVFLILFDLID